MIIIIILLNFLKKQVSAGEDSATLILRLSFDGHSIL